MRIERIRRPFIASGWPLSVLGGEREPTHTSIMPVPQRITVVTLGARSVPSLRAFYRAMGWEENDGSDETYTSFTMGSLRLALYPIELLGKEAAPRDAGGRVRRVERRDVGGQRRDP